MMLEWIKNHENSPHKPCEEVSAPVVFRVKKKIGTQMTAIFYPKCVHVGMLP
jgi:hypothetical protein